MPATGLYISQIEGKPGQVYYPLELRPFEVPTLKDTQVLIKITACALNHRDLFIRQALYPGISFSVPLCADAVGIVTSTGSSAKQWAGKRVVINPGTGWKSDPAGPEDPTGYKFVGGTKLNPNGAAVTQYVSEANELEDAPDHLSDFEAAALPLAGLTGFRATHTKAKEAMAPGKNVLVTGIGGGVAIMAMLFAVGAGANVYVSSGSVEKIRKAVEMGAKGGINYKEQDWEKKLAAMLPKENKLLDAIIDGAGGDIVTSGIKLLKAGGCIVQYGMTVGPKMTWSMPAVLKNIDLRGTTMGSRKEFTDMVSFVREKKLRPIVSKIVNGLDNIPEVEGLFEEMKNGNQFGKLVIQIARGSSSNL